MNADMDTDPDNIEDAKSKPVVAERKESGFGVGGVGSLALIGLLLIVVLTVLIVRSQNSEEDLLSFAPADSFYALEVENIEGAAEILQSVPLWKDDALKKEDIIAEFSNWFGADRDIIKRFAGNIKSVTFVESFVAKQPEKMLILKVGNGWDIENYFRREYSKVSTPVTVAPSMHGLEITRPDKGVFYLKKVAGFVVLAENKDLLIKALAAYKKEQLSLAECNIRFGDGEDGMPRVRMYAAINSFFINYPQYRESLPPTIYNKIAGDSAFLYEATISSTGFIAEGRFIQNKAAGYASGSAVKPSSEGGFFSTLLWIILIIIIIIIAFPIVFVLFTLLLALYFFLLAWWKGELVSIDPPLKDLSNNLKDDLGLQQAEQPEEPTAEEVVPEKPQEDGGGEQTKAVAAESISEGETVSPEIKGDSFEKSDDSAETESGTADNTEGKEA